MKLSRRSLFESVGVVAVVLATKRLAPKAVVLHGDGVTDDTSALQAWGRGEDVVRPDGSRVGRRLEGCRFLVSDAITISRTDGVALIDNHFDYRPR